MAVKLSPAALVTKAALFTFVEPSLAQDAKRTIDYDQIVKGLTSKNFTGRGRFVMQAVRQATDGKLAMDDGIADLASLLSALKPQVEQADQAPGLGQLASAPGGSAGPMGMSPSPDQGGSTHDILAKVKAYLEQEGVAPEILNNLDAFLAEHQPNNNNGPPAPAGPPPQGGGGNGPMDRMLGGQDRIIPSKQEAQDQESGEEIEGEPGTAGVREMGPRGGETGDVQSGEAIDEEPDPWRDETTEDDEIPDEQEEQLSGVATVSSAGKSSRVVNGGGGQDRMPITKAAMDKAIKLAQDRAIQNQRAIRDAERFVRPWVGDLAMDAAARPSDVYRAALKALNVPGMDKVHPDALKPILQAQPRPSQRLVTQRSIAQDSGDGGSFLDRFPDAAKITIQ